MTPPGRLGRRLVGLAVGLLVGLAACELLVRWRVGVPLVERPPLLVVQANPFRGWEMVPGLAHYTYLHRVEINSLGLRGAEVPAHKAPGEVRVLALGDSMTYGQGVADGDTLPARLELELRALASDRDWRVVNAGLRGYSTRQELGLLEELGARLQPDVVLLLWYWNDLDPVDVGRIHARLAASGPVTMDISAPFEGRHALLWHAKQLLRRSALLMYAHELRKTVEVRDLESYVQQGLERLPEELERFEALCAGLGARPLVALVPDVGVLMGEHWTAPVAARVAGLAAARGLAVVDLAPALAPLVAGGRRPPTLPYDGHYEPRANQAMAEALVKPVLAALE